jgi:hypothetical protein
MAREDSLHLITSEFKVWGVKFSTRTLGSGHIELRWQASPDKEVRTHVIAKTGSDWRGWLNERAHIRRVFKADGLSLKEPERKEKVLTKALALPEPVEKDADQIRMLRAEVSDLTEMLLEMRDMWMTQMAPPLVPESVHCEPGPSVRSIRALDHVTEAWNSTETIAKAMGLPREIAYRKLYHLTRNGGPLELSDGRWRKKPQHLTVVPIAPRQQRRAQLNG